MKFQNIMTIYKKHLAKKKSEKAASIREAKEQELIERRMSMVFSGSSRNSLMTNSCNEIKDISFQTIDKVVEEARQSVHSNLSKSSSVLFKHFCNEKSDLSRSNSKNEKTESRITSRNSKNNRSEIMLFVEK